LPPGRYKSLIVDGSGRRLMCQYQEPTPFPFCVNIKNRPPLEPTPFPFPFLLVKANRSMDELQVTATNLQHASVNVHLASTNLPAISEAIGQEAKELPGLVLQTQTSMRELERLIEATQRHWLLRKYVNKTNPPPLRPWSASQELETKPVKVVRSPRDSGR
jgi:hypothetical protein